MLFWLFCATSVVFPTLWLIEVGQHRRTERHLDRLQEAHAEYSDQAEKEFKRLHTSHQRLSHAHDKCIIALALVLHHSGRQVGLLDWPDTGYPVVCFGSPLGDSKWIVYDPERRLRNLPRWTGPEPEERQYLPLLEYASQLGQESTFKPGQRVVGLPIEVGKSVIQPSGLVLGVTRDGQTLYVESEGNRWEWPAKFCRKVEEVL
jgi:hypothetical protein